MYTNRKVVMLLLAMIATGMRKLEKNYRNRHGLPTELST